MKLKELSIWLIAILATTGFALPVFIGKLIQLRREKKKQGG